MCVSEIIRRLESLFPPEVPSGFDKPLEAPDYWPYVNKCHDELPELIETIQSYFSEVGKLRPSENVDLICSVLIVCGSHSNPSSLWTSFNNLKYCRDLLRSLLDGLVLELSTVKELLSVESALVLKKVLKLLRPKLLKSSWKMNLPAVEVYDFVLRNIEPLLLSELLDDILPTALIVADDFETENKVKGVRCLDHIITHVERADLSYGERGQVIFKTLEPMLVDKEPKLINALIPCFISLLSKLSSKGPYNSTEYGCVESVLESMLTCMYLERQLGVREAYCAVLPLLITSSALSSVRFSSQVLDVVEEYTLEPTSSLAALKCLESFFQVAWPVIQCFQERILIFLLKALRDSTQPKSYHDKRTSKEIERLLKLLCLMEPTTVSSLKSAFETLNFTPEFTSSLMSVINTCT